ncbi:MAG: hypothetical protein D9V47_04055 [Clostridia bacterium]|nr:MAG: hypothetical protein D9V47_04055 [Clostridia bacterium]
MSQVKSILQRRRHELLALPNVVGVGRGRKLVRGEDTGEEAIVVLVETKVPEAALRRVDKVPRSLAKVPTDVIEVGSLQLLNVRTSYQRPAHPGVSIGHYKITAGTLGAVVKDRKTGEPLILSNNHVLANSTNGSDGRAGNGDPVLQPGRYDGGRMDQVIGHLVRFSPLVRPYAASECEKASSVGRVANAMLHLVRPNYRLVFERRANQHNIVDAAVARPVSPEAVSPEILEIGMVTGVAEGDVGMAVMKSGRTSGLNRSQIRAMEATVQVGLETREVGIFTDQIVTGPMAQPGDSGSLVVNEQGQAVGLLFAGSDLATICNRIQNVMEVLQITF